MDNYMGRYVNIGLIAEKRLKKVIKLVSTLDEFYCKRIDYPTDEEYSGWMEIQIENNSIDVAIDYCNVQFQYLVVKKDSGSIRILPRVFKEDA